MKKRLFILLLCFTLLAGGLFALHASGDILGTYAFGCDIFRKRIECAVMMKAAQAQASCGEPAGDADAEEV